VRPNEASFSVIQYLLLVPDFYARFFGFGHYCSSLYGQYYLTGYQPPPGVSQSLPNNLMISPSQDPPFYQVLTPFLVVVWLP